MSAVPSSGSAYDASPDRALEQLAAHGGLVFVDLDETLYLGNSTEDFIDLARPGLIAMLLLRVLDGLRLWKLTGGTATRDCWRVGLIWFFFPGTRARWHAQVPKLARELANQPLVAALRRVPGEAVILTAGFRPIVEPLVEALGFPGIRIIACRLASFADRRQGKLQAAVSAVGPETLGSSLVVTDSLDDLPLLAKCGTPLRTVWPGARFRRAFTRIYLPGDYITHVKRPGEQYIARVIIQEDLFFWVLASVFLAPHPWLHIAGVTFLIASFWTIYERGYVDNDWAAAHLEHDGKLSKSFWQSPVATPPVQPWIWATVLGAIAVTLLEWPAALRDFPAVNPTGYLTWLAVLISTYATFKIYNRIDKSTRIWLFAALQLARSAALIPLVAVPAMGAAGLGALALARWVPYYMYRLAGGTWPAVQPNLMRLLFFVVLAAVLGCALGADVLINWTAAGLLLWNLLRARTELLPTLGRIRLLARQRQGAQREVSGS
jgi:hypothetical protein